MKKQQQGVSLVEVLVTFLVLSIGMLGMASMQRATVKENVDTTQRSQAMWLVQELIERMRANESGLGSGYTNAAVLIGGGCPASIPKICSNHHYDGSAKTDAATDCTADEVATSDVWEVYCGYQNTDVVSNSSDNLELTAMNITCADSTGGICDDGTTFTVAVSWTAKAVESKTNTAESSAKSINLSFRP